MKNGMTEKEFEKYKQMWKESSLSKDKAYLKSPEGKLMKAIYED